MSVTDRDSRDTDRQTPSDMEARPYNSGSTQNHDVADHNGSNDSGRIAGAVPIPGSGVSGVDATADNGRRSGDGDGDCDGDGKGDGDGDGNEEEGVGRGGSRLGSDDTSGLAVRCPVLWRGLAVRCPVLWRGKLLRFTSRLGVSVGV
jgi:hypothetical protein